MDNFDKKKRVVADLPDTSPDYKNTNLHQRKMVLTKKNIHGMLNIY